MATSNFRRRNRQIIGAHVEDLISHFTGLEADDENFDIAKRFVWGRFDNNNFPDPNEHLVKSQIQKIMEKLIIHSQDERADRLKYLIKEFTNRKTLKQVGMSDTHMCIINFLMCLSVNPTGAGKDFDPEGDEAAILAGRIQDYGIGGVNDDLPSTKIYQNRADVNRINQEKFEKDLQDLNSSPEMKQINHVKRQWERELEAEEGDSSYDEQEDSEDEDLPRFDQEDMDMRDEEYQAHLRPKPAVQSAPKQKQVIPDQQLAFGGLPLNDQIKFPIIKTLAPRAEKKQQLKKFGLNDFLDNYLQKNEAEQSALEQSQEQKEIETQYELKDLLQIRTFDEIQKVLSQRFNKPGESTNPLLIQHGASRLHATRSSMLEPNNLNRDLNLALNPYDVVNKSSECLTTERKLVLDVLQMLSQPSVESETFIRDPTQLRVLFKMRHQGEGFNLSTSLSHLSQSTVQSTLNQFLDMSNELQKTCFFFRGIEVNSEKLSHVMQALIFAFNKILNRFNQEINDLIQIVLFQAGQISKSQLALNPTTYSRISLVYAQYQSQPLTLLKLGALLSQNGLFSKITALLDIMEKGILDFVAFNHNQEAQKNDFSDEFSQEEEKQDVAQSFLRLAEENKKQTEQDKSFEMDDSQEINNDEIQHDNYRELVNNVQNSQGLPMAQLNFAGIKPADRATYLLNYLYMQIQTDQLLVDNLQNEGNEKLNIFKECFLLCLKPYIKILNDWVCKGDDDLARHDLKNEFFIKANHKIFNNQEIIDNDDNYQQQNSRKRWNDSYVFRTINISQLLGQAIGEFGNMLFENNAADEKDDKKQAHGEEHIEISCPIFLRPIMKQILSVGKSIKIVRYLENSIKYQLTRSKLDKKQNDGQRQIQDTLDHQGIEYDVLSRQNVKQIRVEPLNNMKQCKVDFLNGNQDMPKFQLQAIAKTFIDQQGSFQGIDEFEFYQRKIESKQNMLQTAPFQMTQQYDLQIYDQDDQDAVMEDDSRPPGDQQFLGLFQMPNIISGYQTEHSELNNTLQFDSFQKQQVIHDQLVGGQLTIRENIENASTNENSPKELSKPLVFGNKRPAQELVIGDAGKIINDLQNQHFFNFAKQELNVYQHSMKQYQSDNAFEYYLNENREQLKENQIALNHSKIVFEKLTIENYVYETMLLPIQEIFGQTSFQFLNRYLMSSTPQYCQLQDQIELLHKVYFLQGVSMQKFVANLFDKIDADQHGLVNQLYMVNGNFQEALGELLTKSLQNLNKNEIHANMNVNFDNSRKGKMVHKTATDCLDSINIQYNCEWPIEIIIDKLTISRQYNRIFQLLVQIKYAKFIMEKRDYHIKEPNLLRKTSSYTYATNYKNEIDEMGVRDRLMLQNQIMLGQLLHQFQLFQRELLHFITTMDDYFMRRATYMECMKFQEQLEKLKGSSKKDLDDIIEMHDNYLSRIISLCLMDTKSQELLKYVMEVVEICQEFRKLVKAYLLQDAALSDDDSDQDKNLDDSYDYERKGRSKKIEDRFDGMGILKFNSTDYVANLEECQTKLNFLKDKFKKQIYLYSYNLNKLTKTQSGKIILSYLQEILQRLNFNSFYIGRDEENLPPVGYFN